MNLKDIKGIGPKSLELLEKLEINNVEELVTYYPFRYEQLKKTSLYSDKAVVTGIIESSPSSFYAKKIHILRFKALIENTIVNVVIFNRAFLKRNLSVGKKITLIGKYDESLNKFTASDIKLYDIGDEIKITPIYHLIKGLTNTNINKYINNALTKLDINDYIPNELINKYSFMNKKEALSIIHNPINQRKISEAIIRCKYEELFLFMLKINALKRKNEIYLKGYSKQIDDNKINEFISSLEFELTNDQLKVLEEIKEDLKSEKRMNRLLEGDVGSGKTIVAMISMYMMHLNGYQSALMAPTEILAKQHYQNAIKLFEKYNIKICMLLGSTSKKEKEEIKEKIKNKEYDIVIGTHAILQDTVEFNNLGLVITDEQHRFGVNQRNSLRNKGNMPDVLYMSATPIPRTFALTIYGDMDISIIKEVPKGRKKIITKVKNNEEIKEVLKKIKSELDQNHQIYIVSPLIENSDDDKEDIDKLYKKFNLAFKNYNIGILHGKMKAKEKEEIMDQFLNKKIDILISTTVIEVGVDVRNATMIVIFDAYNFGLATLHQLRGRVGRNDFQSYCVLMTDRETKRLKIMEETTDGFKLAEEDFKLRGYGDLFGTRQSGDMTFKIANLTKDYKMLMEAKKDSDKILQKIDEYPLLKSVLKKSINID